jgi:hypothetical protein
LSRRFASRNLLDKNFVGSHFLLVIVGEPNKMTAPRARITQE